MILDLQFLTHPPFLTMFGGLIIIGAIIWIIAYASKKANERWLESLGELVEKKMELALWKELETWADEEESKK